MILNYLKIALRSLKRNKLFSFINVFGLSVGLASFIVIILYIDYELSYDKHIKDSERVFRVCNKNEDGELGAHTSALLLPLLKSNYPEIEYFARISRSSLDDKSVVYVDGNAYTETGCFLVDSSFFNIFDCSLISGSFSRFNRDRGVVVITEKIARKYFNSVDVIGKSLTINEKYTFMVIGVINNQPKNSYLQYDILLPFSWIEEFVSGNFENWGQMNYRSYIKLKKNVFVDNFRKKIIADASILVEEDRVSKQLESIFFQPLRKMHLEKVKGNYFPIIDLSYLLIYLGIAFVILIIACINFMNLITATYLNRVKEVGIRKVIGAYRKKIIIQFLCESILLTSLALFFAIVMVESVLPMVNMIQGTAVYLDYTNIKFILFIIGIILFIGFISGSYPAFFVSGVQPAYILKSGFKAGKSNVLIKNVLVVFQFIISIALIIISMVIYLQMRHVRNVDLGYNRKNLINIPTYTESLAASVPELKRVFLQNPHITSISANSFLPSDNGQYQSACYEGEIEECEKMISHVGVDENFFETYQMQLLRGSNITSEDKGWKIDYILNESAVKELGWKDDPIGKKISLFGPKNYGKVIGVVKDANFKSLHIDIAPCLFHPEFSFWYYSYLTIRVDENNINSALQFLEIKWKEINPNFPFEYFFVDDDFNNMYKEDMRAGQLVTTFSILSIIISCLGLFGLVAYSAQQRTREISVRKVFGASIYRIVYMLSADYTKWVLIANLIAWPISYFILDQWLQKFYYRIQIPWWVFVFAGIVTLLIALLTVSYQAIKSANTNPSETLKFE